MESVDTPDDIPVVLTIGGDENSFTRLTNRLGFVDTAQQLTGGFVLVPDGELADQGGVVPDDVGIDGFILFQPLAVAEIGFMDALHALDEAAVEALPILIVLVCTAVGDDMGDVLLEDIQLALYPASLHTYRDIGSALYHALGFFHGTLLQMAADRVGKLDFFLHIGGGLQAHNLLVVLQGVSHIAFMEGGIVPRGVESGGDTGNGDAFHDHELT